MPTPKALASIGSGLSMSKEYRDVFEDLIEKVECTVAFRIGMNTAFGEIARAAAVSWYGDAVPFAYLSRVSISTATPPVV